MNKCMAHAARTIVIVAALFVLLAVSDGAAPAVDAAWEGRPLAGAGQSAPASLLDCPDDEWEPNGSFDLAKVITPGNTYAYICPQDDKDYFRFWVDRGQEITLEMDDMPRSYDLWLYDINRDPCFGYYGDGLYRKMTYSDPQVPSGYWYAFVSEDEGEWSETQYELSLTLGPAPPQPLLDLSKQLLEPAGGIATVGGPVRFQITLHNAGPTTITTLPLVDNFDDVCLAYEGATPAPDNADLARHLLLWYNLGPLAPGASKAVTVDFAARAECETALNRAGVTTAEDEHGVPVPERLVDATVRIAAATPTPTATATVPACPADHEPNGTFEEAAIITPDSEVLSYICPADDLDTFQFYAENGQEIRVSLYHMSYNADLELYSPSEVRKGLSDHLGTADEELEITADQTGQFYVRVFGTEGGQINPYHLLVTVSGAPVPTPTPTATATPMYPGCPDGFEPNDWCGTDKPAWDLTASGFWSYICSEDDVDYWRLPSVAAGQTLDIHATCPQGLYDLGLFLYDPQCQYVTWATIYSGRTERLLYTVPVSGTWYARNSNPASRYSASAAYHISGSVHDCALDRFEDNDDATDRTGLDRPLAARSELGLSICPPGEQDWFGVLLHAGDNLVATLTHDTDQGPLKMCLYDAFASTILQCTDPSLPALNRIDYVSPDRDHYYLMVEAATPGGTNPNYGISVQAFPPPTATPTVTPTATPTATATPVPDLQVAGMEIVQVTQRQLSPPNDVPLVAGKTTAVRIYMSSTYGWPIVHTRLRVVGGSPRQSAYLYPQPPDAWVKQGTNPRASLSESANFVLPAEYTVPGLLLIIAEVNYDGAVQETDYSNNTGTLSVTFNERQPVNLVFLRVRYHIRQTIAGTPTVTPTVLVPPADAGPKGSDYTVKVFPVPDVNIYIPTAYEAIDFYGDLATWAGWGDLLGLANQYAKHTDTRGASGVTKWYAMVPDLHGALRAGILGMAYVRGTTAVGYGGTTMAHELGHTFGRLHAPCGNPKGVDPNYPDPGALIQQFGLDPVTMQLYDPDVTFDLMSYCGPEWISPYTYEGLYSAIGPPVQASALSSDEHDYLLVEMELDSEGGEGHLGDAYVDARPRGTNDVSGQGAYSIELQDAASAVLFTRRFDPTMMDFSDGSTYAATSWLEVLPFTAGTQRIVLRHQGRELDRRERSAHAPAVAVTYPNGGEALDSEFEVRWNGSDEDGDSLVYTLQYSIDGGQSWTAAAVGLATTSYTLDAAQMAGSSAGKMRVLASDGLNTTADESDGSFSVPKKPPEAYILTPDEGAAFEPGDFIILRGVATDREDGPLAGQALTWTSDQHGALGSGEEVLAPPFDPGWHDVVLRAVDSDGDSAEDTIRLWVGSRLYLPMSLK